MVWLLFLKVFDAQEEELELTRDDYRSPIPEDLRWRSWATDPEGITGDALLDFVNNQLFPKLKNLAAEPPDAAEFAGLARSISGPKSGAFWTNAISCATSASTRET